MNKWIDEWMKKMDTICWELKLNLFTELMEDEIFT